MIELWSLGGIWIAVIVARLVFAEPKGLNNSLKIIGRETLYVLVFPIALLVMFYSSHVTAYLTGSVIGTETTQYHSGGNGLVILLFALLAVLLEVTVPFVIIALSRLVAQSRKEESFVLGSIAYKGMAAWIIYAEVTNTALVHVGTFPLRERAMLFPWWGYAIFAVVGIIVATVAEIFAIAMADA